MNTEQSTDGAGTECVRSEYGAQYGRSGDGAHMEWVWSRPEMELGLTG